MSESSLNGLVKKTRQKLMQGSFASMDLLTMDTLLDNKNYFFLLFWLNFVIKALRKFTSETMLLRRQSKKSRIVSSPAFEFHQRKFEVKKETKVIFKSTVAHLQQNIRNTKLIIIWEDKITNLRKSTTKSLVKHQFL